MDVLDYIAHESERQSATAREVLGMYKAYQRVCEDVFVGRPWTTTRICFYARLINGVTGYRNVPVYFRDGGHAIPHGSIPRAMAALLEALNDAAAQYTEQREGYTVGFSRADLLTKEFLDIHPFTDGNGRVASLIWNRLNNTLGDPEPMPYFYGEENK